MNLPGVGQHALLDLYGIDIALACNTGNIEALLRQAAHIAQATILQGHFHSFGPQQGVTGVLLLSESHMSIHTWPEYKLATIDIFMCGTHQIHLAVDFLIHAFYTSHHELVIQNRGNPRLLR